MVVGHFAAALAREHEQRGNAPVDVDPAVAARRTGLGRQCVELLFVFHEVLGQALQHLATLVERHLAQVGAADMARMCQDGPEIEPLARDVRDSLTIDRTVQRCALAGAFDPAILRQVAEFCRHTKLTNH